MNTRIFILQDGESLFPWEYPNGSLMRSDNGRLWTADNDLWVLVEETSEEDE